MSLRCIVAESNVRLIIRSEQVGTVKKKVRVMFELASYADFRRARHVGRADEYRSLYQGSTVLHLFNTPLPHFLLI